MAAPWLRIKSTRPASKERGAFFFWAASPRRSLKGGTPARLCGAAWGTRTLCQKKDWARAP